MKKFLCLIMALLLIFAFCGCTISTLKDNDKINIVAVSFPEYDFARAVAGDKATITMLIPPAGEAHGYEPTVSDITAVNKCDLFIYTGTESDTWVKDILNSVNKVPNTIAMADCVETLCTEEHDHHTHNFDEHVWTSPENAILIVNTIKETLCSISSDNTKNFESNAKTYCEKLTELDKEIKEATENAQRNTLVFGDRFPLAYFAESYNLEYLAAFSGCSEDTEASASTVAKLIDYIKGNNIPVVFTNELSNTTIADQIAKETGAEVRTFYSCHKVSKDDFKSSNTYVDIMSRNIENLKIALN